MRTERGMTDGLTFLSSSLLPSRSSFLSLEELRLPEFLGAALGPLKGRLPSGNCGICSPRQLKRRLTNTQQNAAACGGGDDGGEST